MADMMSWETPSQAWGDNMPAEVRKKMEAQHCAVGDLGRQFFLSAVFSFRIFPLFLSVVAFGFVARVASSVVPAVSCAWILRRLLFTATLASSWKAVQRLACDKCDTPGCCKPQRWPGCQAPTVSHRPSGHQEPSCFFLFLLQVLVAARAADRASRDVSPRLFMLDCAWLAQAADRTHSAVWQAAGAASNELYGSIRSPQVLQGKS